MATAELNVDDILRAVWGYDQTNISYYQVTRISGEMCELRQIECLTVEDRPMQGTCVPRLGVFVDESKCPVLRRHVIPSRTRRRPLGGECRTPPSVRISDGIGCAYLKRPLQVVAGVPVFEPDRWTAYA